MLDAAESFNQCFACGMDISIGRKVYDAGELGFGIVCPTCSHQFDPDGDTVDWGPKMGQWYDSGEIDSLTCPECVATTPFTGWFRPTYGFGNLAFVFNEWFLKPEFVDYVAGLLGHRVTLVSAQY